ncbi:MAG TPA: FHA domain-containing protein [Dehalococcoidia bacterium]|jgi:pSer/pThr/pTyr-binding forkhead associated (FHA) protein
MSALEDGIRLSWKDPEGAGGEVVLSSDELTIGRAATCGVVLNDPKVSREHARVRLDGQLVRLRDLGSRNGTFVNGEGVSQADLHPGDEVRVGRVRMTLIVPAPAADATLVGTVVQQPAGDKTVVLGAPESSPVAVSSDGTVVIELKAVSPDATLVLAPVAPARPEPTAKGVVSDELLMKPVISEQELTANGVEVKVVEAVTLGGGMGSFMFVDILRNSGMSAADIRIASNEEKPYGRYRRLVRNSQIPERERLRSNSESCPDNIWGFPGYAVREIWREFWRFNWRLAAKVAYQLWGEPTIAPTFTARTEDVWRGMDRESKRIDYEGLLVLGRIRAIRKTQEGRILAVVSQSDDQQRKHVAVSARFVHLATGYPSLRFLPDLAEFREKHGDREHVVHSYENHDHVYEYLRANGGTVVLRGRGIVASRIIQRLYEERRNNKDIRVVHLHRSKLTKGHRFGPSQRGVADDFEFQPFNWPKSNWTGQSRYQLERASPEKRKELLDIWGGTTTADRPDWTKIVRRGIEEGWYVPEYGVVREVKPGPQGGLVTYITSSLSTGGTLELPADFMIDCTGLIAAPERAPMLKDFIETFNIPKNPLGGIHVSNDFEIEAMRHGDAHMYACGAVTLGGPHAAVDSFLGLQYAGLRAVWHMKKCKAKKLHKLNGLYSFIQWLKYARGVAP